jgi:hypothetical protein
MRLFDFYYPKQNEKEQNNTHRTTKIGHYFIKKNIFGEIFHKLPLRGIRLRIGLFVGKCALFEFETRRLSDLCGNNKRYRISVVYFRERC